MIRTLLLVLHLLISYHAVSDDYYVFTENGKFGLKENGGKIIIPAIYERLGWTAGGDKISGDAIGYFEQGNWGLISVKNKILSPAVYYELDPISNNQFIASRLGKFSKTLLYGILGEDGKVQVSFQYEEIKLLGSGNFLVTERVNGLNKKGILNKSEEIIVPIEFQTLSFDQRQNIYVKTYGQTMGLYAPSGSQLIPANYSHIEPLGSEHLRVDHQGLVGLFDYTGENVIPVEKKDIFLEHGEIAVLEYPDWQLRTASNEVITNFRADSLIGIGANIYQLYRNNLQVVHNLEIDQISEFRDKRIIQITEKLIVVEGIDKYEVIKKDGSQFVKGFYDSIVVDQHYVYVKSFQQKQPWSIYNKFGSRISSFGYDEIRPTSAKVIPVKRNNYWGLIDFSGKEIAKCKFDSVGDLINNRIIIEFHDTWGLMDNFGEWVIYPYEHSLTRLYDSTYMARKERSIKLFDHYGKIVSKITDRIRVEDFGILVIGDSGKLGLRDKHGRLLTSIAYDEIFEVPNSDMIEIHINGEIGVIRQTGRLVIPIDPLLQEILGISEGLIGIKKDGKYGFVDERGNLRISNRYDSIRLFSDGMAAININDNWGFITSSEQLAIQPIYKNILPFHSSITAVNYDGNWGVINREGEVMINYEYDGILRTPFKNYIVQDQGKQGLINELGAMVIYPKYDHVEDLGNENVIVHSNDKWGVLNYDGSYTIPNLFDHMDYDPINKLYLSMNYTD